MKVSDGIGVARFRADGKGLLVADTAGRQLCVMDASARIIVNLPLAVRPDNLCFNEDGGQLFITGEGRDAVVVIFPYYVPQVAETVLAGHAPGAMAASATHLFLANPKAGDVTILNIDATENHRRHRSRRRSGLHHRHTGQQLRSGAEPAIRRYGRDPHHRACHGRSLQRKSAPLFTMIPVGSQPVSAAVKAV